MDAKTAAALARALGRHGELEDPDELALDWLDTQRGAVLIRQLAPRLYLISPLAAGG